LTYLINGRGHSTFHLSSALYSNTQISTPPTSSYIYEQYWLIFPSHYSKLYVSLWLRHKPQQVTAKTICCSCDNINKMLKIYWPVLATSIGKGEYYATCLCFAMIMRFFCRTTASNPQFLRIIHTTNNCFNHDSFVK